MNHSKTHLPHYNNIHHSDVAWAAWYLKSLATRLFVQQLYQANNIAQHYWSFVRGIHQQLVDSPHKGPVMQTAFPCHDDIMFHHSTPTWADLANMRTIHNIDIVCPTLVQTPARLRFNEVDTSVKKAFNTLRPRHNSRHFPDDMFKCIFLTENVWIPITISVKFVPKGPINNIPALV